MYVNICIHIYMYVCIYIYIYIHIDRYMYVQRAFVFKALDGSVAPKQVAQSSMYIDMYR